jgi:hypothetical protein
MPARRLGIILFLAALGVSWGILSPAFAEEFHEQFTIAENELRLGNLIGEIRVEGHSGSAFEVDIHVQGTDASRDQIRVEQKDGINLVVLFPVDREKRYVYPRIGKHSKTTFTTGNRENGGWWKDLLGLLKGDKIEVRGSGKGVEMWADVTVKVPRGKKLVVRHGVGKTTAAATDADLALNSRSGSVEVDDHKGRLSVDTGSGGVRVSGAEGDVNVDTGSGHVTVENIEGALNVDTGSGGVEIFGCRGSEIFADTGSGGVRLQDVSSAELSVDTGSGGITATAVETKNVSLDTGSGSVELELSRLDKGDVHIDTGSGSIRLELPPTVSARVEASTGSGGISFDLDDYKMVSKSKHHKIIEIGDGDIRITLETGSGSIKVRS